MTALFVVLTFILFIAVDILVLKAQKKKHPAFAGAEDMPVFSNKTIAHPANVYISRGHLWVNPVNENNAKIGIDDFIVKALGKIKLTTLVKEGNLVNKGDILFEGAGLNFKILFHSPFKGIIKNLNKPENLSQIQNPFKDWVLELSSNELAQTIADLKSGAELNNWMKQEFARLKDFLSLNARKPELAGITMQDGGNIVEGVLAMMDNKIIKAFEDEFLLS